MELWYLSTIFDFLDIVLVDLTIKLTCMLFSAYSFWLACGSNEDSISVIDVNILCQEGKEKEMVLIDSPSYILHGHSGRITKLAWSPHTNGILASASYDGSVQVWDVKRNEGLANYRLHLGRVHCVLWSFKNSDVLFSGGEDFCLHRWKYSETGHKSPPSGTYADAYFLRFLLRN